MEPQEKERITNHTRKALLEGLKNQIEDYNSNGASVKN